MEFLRDPFFWALISMFALVVATAGISGIKLGQSKFLGFLVFVAFEGGRIVLVLPFVPQPRFEMEVWNWVIGSIFLVAAAILTTAAFSIKPVTAPGQDVVLQTKGFYSFTRNPLYLADLFYPIGFSLMFRSTIGLALVPLWWISLLLLVLVEENQLEEELGQPYLEYKKRVRGRIIPGLPI